VLFGVEQISYMILSHMLEILRSQITDVHIVYVTFIKRGRRMMAQHGGGWRTHGGLSAYVERGGRCM
jgi:hypothetical protein